VYGSDCDESAWQNPPLPGVLTIEPSNDSPLKLIARKILPTTRQRCSASSLRPVAEIYL